MPTGAPPGSAIEVATRNMHQMEELAAQANGALTKASHELEKTAATLNQVGQVVIRSESQIKKLGTASEKLGSASENVNGFIQVLKIKPSALVWGLTDQKRAMMNQPPAMRRPSATPVRK